MMDGALALIVDRLAQLEGRALWLVDEHMVGGGLPDIRASLTCLTNRCDTAGLLRGFGLDALLSDFDFSTIEAGTVDTVLYRVSKEKPVVHHLINEALRCLRPGGSLLLSGYKGDGLRTYVDKATRLVDGGKTLVKGRGGARLATIVKRAEPAAELDDSDYTRLRNIAPPDHPVLYSKPGIFGWQKIDKGSAALIDCLPAFIAGFGAPPRSLLDLGCGYGYLSVMAHRLLPVTCIATDNNAAAIAACEKNFLEHGIEGRVVPADCGKGIEERVDAVLCNPPFHRGFDTSSELTDRFLAASCRLLKENGQALYVVNRFIPLERKAQRWFRAVDILADTGGFRVLRLRR